MSLRTDLANYLYRVCTGAATYGEIEHLTFHHNIQPKGKPGSKISRYWSTLWKMLLTLSIVYTAFEHILGARINEKAICQAASHGFTMLTSYNVTSWSEHIQNDYELYVRCVREANRYLIPMEYYRNLTYWTLTTIAYVFGPIVATQQLYKSL